MRVAGSYLAPVVMALLVVCGVAAFQILTKEDPPVPPAEQPVIDDAPEPAQGVKKQDGLVERLLAFTPPPTPTAKPQAPMSGAIASSQVRLYKDIRALQDKSDWAAADKLIRHIKDPRLMGYILYQRYMHPTDYKTGYPELFQWMERYAELPGAEDIYALALRKSPQGGARTLKEPDVPKGIRGYLEFRANFQEAYSSPRKRTDAERGEVNAHYDQLKQLVRQGEPGQALQLLERRRGLLDKTEFNIMKSMIASGYMFTGNVKTGLNLARQAADESGVNAPLAGWVAGIAFWRLGRYEECAKYFEMAATSPYANGWTIAGAAFWASRAHMRTGNFKAVSKWLDRATEFPRTFYGLIAIRALGKTPTYNWSVPTYDQSQKDVLLSHSRGVRALALYELGEIAMAERELLRLNPEDDALLKAALLSFAVEAQMPSLSWRLGGAVQEEGGALYDAALYPLLPWVPVADYTIDRALVHAFVRQESKYDAEASNPSGATGLMQLMPSTAKDMVGAEAYQKMSGVDGLKDPATNVRIGQTYMEHLFDEYIEDKDLFGLTISWNAGPGSYLRWKKALSDIDDGLLFIESIPAYETRAFVERVMTYYWIYRIRMGLPTKSLDAVAGGGWPIYEE